MNYQGLRITALDDSSWSGWPSTEYGNTGIGFRRLRAGHKHSLRLPSEIRGAQIAVLCLAEPLRGNAQKHWRVSCAGQAAKVHRRKTFPKHLLLELPEPGGGDRTELLFEPTGSANQANDLLIEEVVIMPRNGRFSELWTSPWRAFKKLTSKQSLPWAPADFPYSHFDGLGYLLDHDEVRQAVLSRKYDTAFRYWYKKGRHRGQPLPLAVHREPLPGTAFNLVMHYKGEYGDGADKIHSDEQHAKGTTKKNSVELEEENELLTLQRQQMQEELKHYVLENKNLKEFASKEKELTTELDQARLERDNLLKERDVLTSSNSERAKLIVELEALASEQGARQKYIDEHLARADGQLAVLESLIKG
jgi:hypothetical protein